MTAVIRPIRWWVRLYTAGLPRRIRDERRAEIESDLWEETCFATEHGLDRVGIGLSVWSRWLLGAADDLMWRAEQRAALRQQARDSKGGSLAVQVGSRRRLLGLASGVAIGLTLVSLIVVVNTIAYYDGTQPTGEVAAMLLALVVLIAALGGITAARGFWIMGARPAEGAILVVGGSLMAGLAWYWLYVPVVLALIISIYAVSRAKRLIDTRTSP